jgi:hypothetical protein
MFKEKMMLKVRIVLLLIPLFVLSLLLGCSGGGGGGTPTTTLPQYGTVSGIVTLEGYSVADGATVTVAGVLSYNTTTASSGAYTVGNISPESYTVTCSKTSFESESVSNVSVQANTTSDQNFYLVPEIPPPPPF